MKRITSLFSKLAQEEAGGEVLGSVGTKGLARWNSVDAGM